VKSTPRCRRKWKRRSYKRSSLWFSCRWNSM